MDHGLRSAPAPTPEDAGASADAAAPEPEPEPSPVVRASFALRAGLAPCRFVFRAGVGSTVDADRFLMSISRIELEASEVCAAQVVYDAEAEMKAAPDRALEALEGGLLPNPGKLAAAAALRKGPDPNFVDANFDGYLDLAVGAASGAYNRSSRYRVGEGQARDGLVTIADDPGRFQIRCTDAVHTEPSYSKAGKLELSADFDVRTVS